MKNYMNEEIQEQILVEFKKVCKKHYSQILEDEYDEIFDRIFINSNIPSSELKNELIKFAQKLNLFTYEEEIF